MPLPNTVPSTSTVYDWLDAFNNTVSHVGSANAYLLIAQNATPSVSSGNASMNGTFTVSTVNVTGTLTVNGQNINGNAVFATTADTANNSTYAFGKTEGALNVNTALTANVATYQSGGWVNATSGTFSANVAVDTNVLFVDTVNDRVGVGTASPSAPLDVNGDLVITGASRRIRATFSGTPVSSRALFQTSVADSPTTIYVIPNGTSTDAAVGAFNGADPANATLGALTVGSTAVALTTVKSGTSVALPLVFRTDNTERMRITENGDIGIGNTAPTSTLHVTGTAFVSGAMTVGGALTMPTGSFLYSRSNTNIQYNGDVGVQARSVANGAAGISFHRPLIYAVNFGLDTDNVLKVGGWSMGNVSYAILHAGNYSTYALPLSGGTISGALNVTGNAAFDTNVLYVDALNNRVGIGTGIPSADLHVVGSSILTANMAVDTNVLFVDTVNNRVGVGTTTPGTQFDVYNNSNTGTATDGTNMTVTSVNRSAAIILNSNNIGGSVLTVQLAGTERGRLMYWHGTNYWTLQGNGTTEMMRVAATGDVGFGTSTPNYAGFSKALTIEGVTAPGIELATTATDIDGRIVGAYEYQFRTANSGHTRIASMLSRADGATAGQRGGLLSFWTKPNASTTLTERMRITQAGDVGIGTLSPNYGTLGRALTIESTTTPATEFASTAADNKDVAIGVMDWQFRTANTNHQRIARILGETDGDTAGNRGGRLSFWTKPDNSTTLTERMRIMQDGRIKIGTGTPTATLDVGGSLAVSGNSTFDTNVLYVDAVNNRVGIGTTTPSSIVQIYNGTNTGTGTDNTGLYVTSVNRSSFLWLDCGAVGSSAVIAANNGVERARINYNHAANYWSLQGNGTTEMVRVIANGNVGIATTAPAEALHVVGNIRNSALAGVGNRTVYSDANGNLTNSSSDARLKANVVSITDALGIVQQLRGIRFNWKDPVKFGEQRELGLLAQDAQPHVPEVVGTNHDGTLSVDYPKLTALLIEAVKELAGKVADLEARLS